MSLERARHFAGVRKNFSDVRLPFMARNGIPKRKMRLGPVAVSGQSMAPTYSQGDWLLVLWGGGYKAGHVIVVERESYPGVFLIKRLITRDSEGNWVEGDNKSESTDSRQWGTISDEEIVGRVLFRYRSAR